MNWDFSSMGNARILKRYQRDIESIIKIEFTDQEKDHYLAEVSLLLDSIHSLIMNKPVRKPINS